MKRLFELRRIRFPVGQHSTSFIFLKTSNQTRRTYYQSPSRSSLIDSSVAMVKRTKRKQHSLPNTSAEGPSRLQILLRSSAFVLYALVSIAALGAAVWSQYYLRTTSSSQNISTSPLWEIVDIPGKGKGMVARRNITQGTLLLRETPLFLVPPTVRQSPEQLIIALVSQLPLEKQQVFDALSHHARPDAVGDALPLAKFETNSMNAGESVGIFPTIARINHGCSSAFNAAYSWREDTKETVVYAFKPIFQGEEILISYTDTKKSRDNRRAYLKQSYNFDCTCSVCSLSPELSKASDARLERMAALREKLATWANKSIGGQEATSVINEIWRLGDEEQYLSERGALAYDAAQVAAAHWDRVAAQAWAELAHKWFAIELGVNSVQAKAALRIAQNPRSHRDWGSRYKMEVERPIAGL